MTYQRLLSYTRKAVDEYEMIQEGDQIAVGVSGGKDSITLALALKGLQRFYPKHFTLKAYTVALGFPSMDYGPLEAFMADWDIPFEVIRTDIAQIVFEERKEKNPCALCAKMRKGAFNDRVKADGCNKVALGHHKEDVVETFLLSLLYDGRLNTFSPVLVSTKLPFWYNETSVWFVYTVISCVYFLRYTNLLFAIYTNGSFLFQYALYK